MRLPAPPLPERLRTAFGRRAAGLFLALLVEALLLVALLTIAPSITGQKKEGALIVFNFDQQADEPSSAEEAAAEPEQEKADRQAVQPPEPRQAPPVPMLPQPVPPPLPMIELTREQLAVADTAITPPAPPRPAAPAVASRPAYGPPAPPSRSAGDTPRVEGSGPNGEPLYAASWYREPYDSELRGYLSTAQGPGWGLIACRTVPEYRVENCVGLDEYPSGSNITRAVLAAAWQFRVRPPVLKGKPQYGEWVRIRIDYSVIRSDRSPGFKAR